MRAIFKVSVSLVFAAAGCVADRPDGSDPGLGQTQQAATTAFANDQPAFEFFIGKGLTNFQAAGIVGNLDQESGVDPTSVQSGGPGRGIAQWSVGGRWDTSANDNVKSYAVKEAESATSLDLQLQFIWYELTTYGYGYSQLVATTNVTDATVAFMAKYEICGDCVQTQRVAYAQDVLAAYGAIPYGASYVSQSWPLASQPAMTVQCGQSVAATLVLKNTGTTAWDGSTRLGTTEPRDRASIFAGADWVAPNRAAQISGSVAPGANGTFAFSFTGPTGAACVPGMYEEYFGVVQDGVAWFSDSGDGGPPDDQIEALIQLVPGVDTGSDGSGGSGGSDGAGGSGAGSDTGSDAGGSGDPDNGATHAGCSAGAGGSGGVGSGGTGALALVGIAAVIAGRRRRGSSR